MISHEFSPIKLIYQLDLLVIILPAAVLGIIDELAHAFHQVLPALGLVVIVLEGSLKDGVGADGEKGLVFQGGVGSITSEGVLALHLAEVCKVY